MAKQTPPKKTPHHGSLIRRHTMESVLCCRPIASYDEDHPGRVRVLVDQTASSSRPEDRQHRLNAMNEGQKRCRRNLRAADSN